MRRLFLVLALATCSMEGAAGNFVGEVAPSAPASDLQRECDIFIIGVVMTSHRNKVKTLFQRRFVRFRERLNGPSAVISEFNEPNEVQR
jgi:hypothetical protein